MGGRSVRMSSKRSKEDFGWDSKGVESHSGDERKVGIEFRREYAIWIKLVREWPHRGQGGKRTAEGR